MSIASHVAWTGRKGCPYGCLCTQAGLRYPVARFEHRNMDNCTVGPNEATREYSKMLLNQQACVRLFGRKYQQEIHDGYLEIQDYGPVNKESLVRLVGISLHASKELKTMSRAIESGDKFSWTEFEKEVLVFCIFEHPDIVEPGCVHLLHESGNSALAKQVLSCYARGYGGIGSPDFIDVAKEVAEEMAQVWRDVYEKVRRYEQFGDKRLADRRNEMKMYHKFIQEGFSMGTFRKVFGEDLARDALLQTGEWQVDKSGRYHVDFGGT